jgi:adenylate cyclase
MEVPPLIVLAGLSILLYAVAAARYYPVWRRRRRALPASVITAFILLAEAMIALTFGRNWQATWWEWHLLYLVAFGIVAYTAHRQWREERFSDLYLEETRGQTLEVSVLFADLKGFTSFSERSDPIDVSAMLNEYFEVAVPMIASKHGGTVDKLIGDAVMVTFNTRGDQPDHAVKAVQAGLALQRETARIVERRPGWPRFRVGVNSDKAMVGLLGAEGGRGYTVIGDTVNLASRLEGQAKPGQVVIGAETYRALPDGTKVEPLGGVQVKGKEAPVEAYIVVELSPDESERDERPRREEPEAGSIALAAPVIVCPPATNSASSTRSFLACTGRSRSSHPRVSWLSMREPETGDPVGGVPNAWCACYYRAVIISLNGTSGGHRKQGSPQQAQER